MKKLSIFLLSTICILQLAAQSYKISGHVYDENKNPFGYVNVYIDGTIDGTSSDEAGKFEFETDAIGLVTLKASFIGYETFSVTRNIAELKDLQIYLKPSAQMLDDVVIVAGNYSLKSASTLKSQDAVSLITTAGSDGDLYKSLSMLPGSQVSGTDNRLLVRGGSSRETQTYIDGMHVLSQYTASTGPVSSRGRNSAFIFEGINFSTGGYSPEYSQSLSGVLPLDTKDESKKSKIGISLMNVSVGSGGTKSWNKGSVSAEVIYTDMRFYNATLHPGENDLWDIPYSDLSAQSQLRLDVGKNAIFKTYFMYDKTRFRHLEKNPFSMETRNMDYNEDNIYLNATFRKKTENNINLFIGAAYSWNRKDIENARLIDDNFYTKEQEVHLKTKGAKRFSNLYKLEIGAESYLKSYDMRYREANSVHRTFDNNISGLFISNDLNLTNKLFFNLSGRVEYSSLTDSYSLLPRVAINYQLKDFIVSGIIGRYQQSTDNDYMIYNDRLLMETNLQTMLSFYYQKHKRIYRVEVYNKKYDNLPLLVDGKYTSKGYGYSRGIDLFFNNSQLFKNFEYMLTYSYNDSKRKFLDYPEKSVPHFVTKHNAAITLKYSNWDWKTIFGVTNRFASGKHYHNPNKPGFMNTTSPVYNSLDLSITVLPHKSIIVYAGASNILNRNNIYGYTYTKTPDLNGIYAGHPTTMYHNRTLYIGIFITLGKNVAYEASNF